MRTCASFLVILSVPCLPCVSVCSFSLQDKLVMMTPYVLSHGREWTRRLGWRLTVNFAMIGLWSDVWIRSTEVMLSSLSLPALPASLNERATHQGRTLTIAASFDGGLPVRFEEDLCAGR